MPKPAAVEITVLGMSGEVVAKVPSTTCPTAGDLREHLAENGGFPWEAVRLFSRESELDDDQLFMSEVTLTVTFVAPEVSAESLRSAACSGHSGFVKAILRSAESSEQLARLLQDSRALEAATTEACTAAVLAVAPAGSALQEALLRADGYVALHASVFQGEDGCVRALLAAAAEAGPAVHEWLLLTQNKEGLTALHVSAQCGQKACMDVLLASAASAGPAVQERVLLARDATGFTALHTAAFWREDSCMAPLLSTAPPALRETLLLATTLKEETALHVAAAAQGCCVGPLVEGAAAADEDAGGSTTQERVLFAKDKRGYTPLHTSADAGQCRPMNALIAAAAAAGSQARLLLDTDGEGRTALHIIITSIYNSDRDECVSMLTHAARGAGVARQLLAAESKGRTPLQLAEFVCPYDGRLMALLKAV